MYPLGKPKRDRRELLQPKRLFHQVLYVPPKPPGPRIKDKVEYRWSFDTEQGRREYEAALAKHLQANKILLGAATFEPLSSSADIAKLADSKFAKLVLIVHGAGDAPAIAVDLGNAAAGIKGDWIKANEFAAQIAAFGFENITILGCDAVGNKFAPNLARAFGSVGIRFVASAR
jgi:hypothetical protein